MDARFLSRRGSLALLAAGLAAPGLAHAAADPPSSPADPKPDDPTLFQNSGLPEAQFTPEDGATEVMGMEDLLRRMTAPVMINGKGPFDFVVDTGTNHSVISDDLAARLGLPMGKPVKLHGIEGEREAPTARLDRFQVGDRSASRVGLPILPAKSMNGAGILGVDGLKNQRVVINLRDARLKIEPSAHPDQTPGASTIKARRRYGQLTVVDTDLEGVQVAVMIDTGSEVTVGNSALRSLLDRRRETGQVQQVTLLGATGDTAVGDYGGVPDFRMGRLKVGNLRVVYADLHPFQLWDLTRKPAMLMGMDVIRFFDMVTLDYGRNEVRFLLPKQPFLDPAGDRLRS